MKAYFSWHRTERERLALLGDYEAHRYLVMRCLADDVYCGGASDRFRSLPYIVLLANQTRRVLFIYWSRPSPLEEFLVPPAGGLDWTIPPNVLESFTSKLKVRQKMEATDKILSRLVPASNATLVDSPFAGAPPIGHYDDNRIFPSEPTFVEVYREVWRTFFEPSRPVAAIIQSLIVEHGLVADQYVSAHVRAQYKRNATGDQRLVENALHCAISAKPDAPIYLASDSTEAIRFGRDYGLHGLNRSVIAMERRDPPLHIDRGSNFLSREQSDWDWSEYPVSAFYDTFVDLYLLSGARCVSYGIGGYGRWASWMSGNASCSILHNRHLCPAPGAELEQENVMVADA
jgi:hypothetical protein